MNLPALSNLYVTKLVEAMACRTFVLTPAIVHRTLFDRNSLAFYSADDIHDAVRAAQYWVNHPEEREAVARNGFLEAHARHRLDQRLQEMLSTL